MLKLQVIGNVGQDARVNEVNGSKSINFSVAYNRKYQDKDGVKHEETTWVNCSYWRKDGQSCKIVEYLKAGTQVFVEGVPGVHQYQGKDNKTYSSLDMNVNNIELLGNKNPADTSAPAKEPGNTELQPSGKFSQEQPNDDLPF